MVRSQALNDRLHRAKSWMDAIDALPADQQHAQFVFLYIAFNALYGRRQYEGSREEAAIDRDEFLKRIKKLRDCDRQSGNDRLLRALQACQRECESLILNYFLRDSYWRKDRTSKELRAEFVRQKRQANEAYKRGRYEFQLELVLKRLAILRNQVMHGCVTFGATSKGLPSLNAGLAVLRRIVPAFYELMDKYVDNVIWPAIPYPRVGSEAHRVVDEVQ